MDVVELKSILVKYKGYKAVEEVGLQSTEEKMLSTIFNLLRVPEESVRKIANSNSKEEEYSDLDEKEIYSIEYIKALHNSLENNYKFYSFITHVLGEAHDNWIIENQDRLDSRVINKAYKFVPLALLDWKDVSKYVTILQPILNSLDSASDRTRIKEQFKKDRILFLLKNTIYSKESLLERMSKPKKFYGQFAGVKDNKGQNIIDKLGKEKVVKQIAEQVDERIDLNLANQLKEVLEIDKNNIGGIYSRMADERKKCKYSYVENIGQKKFGIRKSAYPRIDSPISEILFEISKSNIIWAPNVKRCNYNYTDISNSSYRYPDAVQFVPFEQCEGEQKLIEKRNRKIEKLAKKIDKDQNSKYDESGLITFVLLNNVKPVVSKEKNAGVNKAQKPEIIQIEITKREIIKLGYLPQELGWEKKKTALINSKRSVLISGNKELGFTDKKTDNEKDEFYRRVKVDERNYQKPNLGKDNAEGKNKDTFEKDEKSR